jgi:hypothetical protein
MKISKLMILNFDNSIPTHKSFLARSLDSNYWVGMFSNQFLENPKLCVFSPQ